jgi:hypothetical protein
MRVDTSVMTEVVQRQVYIDGLCFSFFAPEPGNARHQKDISELVPRFEQMFPNAVLLQDDIPAVITTGKDHAASVMFPHVEHYPTRYGLWDEAESPQFVGMIQSLARDKTKLLTICVSKDEIETLDTSAIRNTFEILASTRESAMSAMGKIVLFSIEFDEDPREIWEIPACRNFYRKLFEEVPYMFFFLNVEFEALTCLALCCCDHSMKNNLVEFHGDSLKAFLRRGGLTHEMWAREKASMLNPKESVEWRIVRNIRLSLSEKQSALSLISTCLSRKSRGDWESAKPFFISGSINSRLKVSRRFPGKVSRQPKKPSWLGFVERSNNCEWNVIF